MVDALSVTECLTSTPGVLTLYLLPIVAFFFIAAGLKYRIGFVGFFGALLLMVFSWYLSPCSNFFAFVMGIFSFVLIIYFVVLVPLGVNNDTFK